MKILQRLLIVHLLNALILGALAFAQPVTINTPPPPAPNAVANPIGTPGFTPYYYIVIANYPAGSAASQMISVQNGNATLNGTNYNQVGWPLMAGALTYDVLRLTTPTYTGSCTCSVTTALGPTISTYSDQGGGLSSYTQAAGAQGVQTQMYVNNRDYAFPKLRVQLQNNGTLVSHLAEVPSGAGLPIYCLVGDVWENTTSSTFWGCGPTANTWYLIGGGGGSTSGLIMIATAGTGGTTANRPVKLSGATVVKLLTTDTAPDVPIGIAQATVTAGSTVIVFIGGVASCVADTGGIAAGNLVGAGTTVADTCIDLGQTAVNAVAPNIAIIGRALTTALATATSNVFLFPQTGAGYQTTGTGVYMLATSPAVTTDLHAATAGGSTVGTAALPFSSEFIGGAATNNIQLTGTATAARVATLPDASITVSGATGSDCGSAAGACSVTGIGATMKVVTGTATATSGTPSTVVITGIPAFTSTAAMHCFAEDATTVANVFAVLTAGYVSTSAVTFTGPNTLTDVIRWACIGF